MYTCSTFMLHIFAVACRKEYQGIQSIPKILSNNSQRSLRSHASISESVACISRYFWYGPPLHFCIMQICAKLGKCNKFTFLHVLGCLQMSLALLLYGAFQVNHYYQRGFYTPLCSPMHIAPLFY